MRILITSRETVPDAELDGRTIVRPMSLNLGDRYTDVSIDASVHRNNVFTRWYQTEIRPRLDLEQQQ